MKIQGCVQRHDLFCDNLKNLPENVGFLIGRDELPMYQRECKDSIAIVKNFKLPKINLSLAIKKPTFFHENFRKIVDKLFPTGITQHLIEHHTVKFYGLTKFDDNYGHLMTFEEFRFVITLCLALFTLSIVLFIIEYSISGVKELILDILRRCSSIFDN